MIVDPEREHGRRSHSAPLLVPKQEGPESDARLTHRHDAAGQRKGPAIHEGEWECVVCGFRHAPSLGGQPSQVNLAQRILSLQLTPLVTAVAPGLLALPGVGVETAG